jgi:transcriptional regulator with XRE-family HTH domain
MDVRELGKAILTRRLALDMSQEDLGRRADISTGYLSRLERGRIAQPGAVILDRIYNALGVDSWPALRAVNRPSGSTEEDEEAAAQALAFSNEEGSHLTPADLKRIERLFDAAFERLQKSGRARIEGQDSADS